MADIPKKLLVALEAEEACELDELVQEQNPEDFEALQSLLSLEASVNPVHRTNAIYALGRWGDPAPAAAIRSLLPQLDESARICAVDALGRLGTQEALNGVMDSVDDESPHVRKFAARALGRINTPEARAKLKEIETGDSADFVRDLASKYLKDAQP